MAFPNGDFLFWEAEFAGGGRGIYLVAAQYDVIEAATSVPIISNWMLVLLAGLLALFGFWELKDAVA